MARPNSTRQFCASLQLVGHLGDAGYRAGLFLRLAADGAAQADGADGLLADVDRHATAERDAVRQRALALVGGFRALRPFGGGHPEGARRVGLAAGELDVVGARVVALEE